MVKQQSLCRVGLVELVLWCVRVVTFSNKSSFEDSMKISLLCCNCILIIRHILMPKSINYIEIF